MIYERQLVSTLVVKNMLLYSTLLLGGQAIMSFWFRGFLTPLLTWSGGGIAVISGLELLLVTQRRSTIAARLVGPLFLATFVAVIVPMVNSFRYGPIDFSLKNIAILVGVSTYGLGLLLCALLALSPNVRRQLGGRRQQ
jgi:hypothetical protein